MTMHLVGPYLTTTNSRKRKAKKLTENQRLELEQEWRKHNKHMRRINCHSAQFDTFEQYLSYRSGNHKPRKQESRGVYVPPKDFRRETPYIPSLDSGIGFAPKKESPKYTGTLIKGIATMHKSNAVPITSKEDAIAVSTMRRG